MLFVVSPRNGWSAPPRINCGGSRRNWRFALPDRARVKCLLIEFRNFDAVAPVFLRSPHDDLRTSVNDLRTSVF
jgi:hypothetical protein